MFCALGLEIWRCTGRRSVPFVSIRKPLGHALEGGKGALLVGTHLGSWDLAGLALAARGRELYVVAGQQMVKSLVVLPSKHIRRALDSFLERRKG